MGSLPLTPLLFGRTPVEWALEGPTPYPLPISACPNTTLPPQSEQDGSLDLADPSIRAAAAASPPLRLPNPTTPHPQHYPTPTLPSLLILQGGSLDLDDPSIRAAAAASLSAGARAPDRQAVGEAKRTELLELVEVHLLRAVSLQK